jgi:hypothetical protein
MDKYASAECEYYISAGSQTVPRDLQLHFLRVDDQNIINHGQKESEWKHLKRTACQIL